MIQYLQLVRTMISEFLYWSINKIPRAANSEADKLARYASSLIPHSDKQDEGLFLEVLAEKSINKKVQEALPIEAGPQQQSWMDPILKYLKEGVLPEDKKEAKSLMFRAANYTIINDMLYKRGFTFPYLRCLVPEEGTRVLEELHEGKCSNHIKSQSLYIKALRLRYYWPTMKADAKALVQRYERCQKHARI